MPRLDPGEQVGSAKADSAHPEPHDWRERRIAAARLPEQGIAQAEESRRRFRAQDFGFGVDRSRVAASAALVAPGRCFHSIGLAQVSNSQTSGNPSGRGCAGTRNGPRNGPIALVYGSGPATADGQSFMTAGGQSASQSRGPIPCQGFRAAPFIAHVFAPCIALDAAMLRRGRVGFV